MRHKYHTHGIVLSRAPLGEASALVTLLTSGLGLVRARAQGVRRSGARLSPALATLVESAIILVHGNEGWRIAGAVIDHSWSSDLASSARGVAARISGLLLRLSGNETSDLDLYTIIRHFFEALNAFPEERYDAIEILTALRLLHSLGFSAGDIPGGFVGFSQEVLETVEGNRPEYITRINNGLVASGL